MGDNLTDPSIMQFYREVFEKYYNLNLTFTRYDDYTMKIIKNKSYDAIVLPLKLLEFFEVSDVSDTLFYDSYHWMLRKPLQISSLKTLTFVFNSLILIFFICFYFLMVATWSSFTRIIVGRKVVESFLNIFRITVGMGVIRFPNTRQLKLLLIFFHFYSMCIMSLFQARLASLLAKPPLEKTVNNLRELIESTIMPLVDSKAIDAFKYSSSSVERRLGAKIKQELPTFNTTDLKIDYIISNPNVTAALSDSQLTLYKTKSAKLKKIAAYPYKQEVAFYFRRGHPSLKTVNRVVSAIFEAGIVRK